FVDFIFFFSSRRRHTRSDRDWSSDVCSSDLRTAARSATFYRFSYKTWSKLRSALSKVSQKQKDDTMPTVKKSQGKKARTTTSTTSGIDLKSALKEQFGFKDFKGQQKQIIESLLSGRDTFVIMPTGGGKSLCYQLPAVISPGVA